MYQWRVSKYNPSNRDKAGAFLGDEWVIAQQIGEVFNGKKFTRDDYLDMENRYVSAALEYFKATGLKNLQIKDLQSSFHTPPHLEKHDLVMDIDFTEGQVLGIIEISQVLRMLLREITNGQLCMPDRFFIHVGWDYYMYIGSYTDLPEAKNKTEQLGLFVENFESPYFE